MTYYDLIMSANRKLDNGDINLGKYEEMIGPLKREIEPERKTGHWIEHPHEAGLNWEFSRYECSECHIWFDDDSSYCPECGADMMEESKCSKHNCPIDYTTLNPNCNLKDCPYRTE